MHAVRGRGRLLAEPTSIEYVQPVWPTSPMNNSAQTA